MYAYKEHIQTNFLVKFEKFLVGEPKCTYVYRIHYLYKCCVQEVERLSKIYMDGSDFKCNCDGFCISPQKRILEKNILDTHMVQCKVKL